MIASLILLLVSLAASAFFSGTEIAFLTANRLQLEIDLKRKAIPFWVAQWIANPQQFLVTLLIGNTLALVVVGAQSAVLLHPFLEPQMSLPLALLLETLISTVVVLFVAEYIPKALFREQANRALVWTAVPAMVVHLLFWPASMALTKFNEWVFKRMGTDSGASGPARVFGLADLNSLVDEASQKEEQDPEVELFRNALDFAEVKVRACMVPRPELAAVPLTINLDDLRAKFVETGFSRLIVYREELDDAFAYVHQFELFKKPRTLKSVLTPLSFVPEAMNAQDVFQQLIREKRSMALVVDDLGGLVGMVTLEDIIEELFGEIDDEHDQDSLVEQVLDDGTYRLDGRLEVNYLNDQYALGFPESDRFTTLGGLITDLAGKLPEPGDTVVVGAWRLEVEGMEVQRVKQVLVRRDA
jgi:CBS domain containing-hemolysin-like protein